jgi:hypothetical protein
MRFQSTNSRYNVVPIQWSDSNSSIAFISGNNRHELSVPWAHSFDWTVALLCVQKIQIFIAWEEGHLLIRNGLYHFFSYHLYFSLFNSFIFPSKFYLLFRRWRGDWKRRKRRKNEERVGKNKTERIFGTGAHLYSVFVVSVCYLKVWCMVDKTSHTVAKDGLDGHSVQFKQGGREHKRNRNKKKRK